MSYPKPLKEKTLLTRYAQAGLTHDQIVFLRQFFTVSANLYGCLPLYELWEVYKDLSRKTSVPKIRRSQLEAFSQIARREDAVYRVYEIDEIYLKEERKPSERIIALKELICHPEGDDPTFIYNILEQSCNKPFFVPEDLLTYTVLPVSKEEAQFRTYIENLRSAAKTLTDPYTHEKRENPNRGKRLREFSYPDRVLLRMREVFKDYYSPDSWQYKRGMESVEKKIRLTESERIMTRLLNDIRIGYVETTETINYLFKNLERVGVTVSEKEAQKILNLYSAFQNHTCMYTNHGYSPVSMHAVVPPKGPVSIQIGPNMMKMIENGEIDRREVEEMYARFGIKVTNFMN